MSTETPQTPPATPPAAPTQSWTDGMPDDLKGYVQTKGFSDPKAIAESYRNLEKLHGVPKERLLTLPETLEDPEKMASVWERLGAPKEAKEYKVEVPKELGDDQLAPWFQEQFHKLKVPRQMAEKLVEAFSEREKASLKEWQESTALEIKNQQDAIKREWGAAYETNKTIADQAVQKFEMTNDQVKALGAAMGPAAALKFLHKLGEATGEAKFIAGNQGNAGALTPEAARNQINELIRDTDFARRLNAGDTDAKAKWDRLHQYASPGTMTL